MRGEPLDAARFDLHRNVCSSPVLLELPPLVACEIQLRLLLQLGIATEVSLWRADGGNVDVAPALGDGAGSRRARATAKAALRRGSTLSLLGPKTLRAGLVRRFRTPCAAVVARVLEPVGRADAYLGDDRRGALDDLRARAPARALGGARADCSSAPASSG